MIFIDLFVSSSKASPTVTVKSTFAITIGEPVMLNRAVVIQVSAPLGYLYETVKDALTRISPWVSLCILHVFLLVFWKRLHFWSVMNAQLVNLFVLFLGNMMYAILSNQLAFIHSHPKIDTVYWLVNSSTMTFTTSISFQSDSIHFLLEGRQNSYGHNSYTSQMAETRTV